MGFSCTSRKCKKLITRWPNLINDIRSLSILISVLLSYVFVFYMASFDHRHKENIGLVVGIYLCDIIYGVDSLFRFIYVKKLGSHLDKPLRIRVKKFYPSVLDLLSLLPLEIFILVESVDYREKDLRYLSLFSFLKLNRIIRLYRIQVFYARKTHELRLNLFTRKVFAIIVCFLSFLIILFHGIACTWFRLRCYGVISNEPPLCHRIGETDDRSSIANEIDNNHPYYRHLDNASGDAWGWYVGGLHWSVMSLRNSGNRFLLPASPIQMIISISIQLFGFAMCGAILLIGIYVATQLDLRRSIFFHEAYGARSFANHFKMGKAIINFLNDSFNVLWHQNRAYTDHNMKSLLPKYMRTQICMCIFKPMLEASELLQCFTTIELEGLSLEVHYKRYFANEFIIRPGTLGYNMYYVSQGTVEVMNEEDPSAGILNLAKGTLIGELNIIFPTLRKNAVKTQSACDILKLNYSKVMEVANRNPLALGKMSKILTERMYWISVQVESKRIKTEREEHLAEEEQQELQHDGLNVNQIRPDPDGVLQFGRDPEDSSVKLDPMEAQFRHRRITIAHDVKSWRKRSETTRRYFTGAQFMSVLAWVKFYRGKNENAKINPIQAFIYSEMHKNFRCPASIILYKVVPDRHPPNYVWDRFVISKRTMTYWLWNNFIFLLIIFHSLIFPYELVISTEEFCQPINAVVEVVYYFDVFLRLFIFFDSKEMSPVATVLAHITHEFRRIDIIFDILAILPIHHIAKLQADSYREYLYYRIHTVIFKFWRLLKRFRKWENDVTTLATVIRICKHTIFISVYIFWLASVFCTLGCPFYPDCEWKPENETTWVTRFFDIENDHELGLHKQNEFFYAFPLALYWAVCVTFGIGFAEGINPSTRTETSWQTVGLLFGFVMCTLFCADLASSLAGSSKTKSHHQDKAIWLDRYLDDALIELKLIARVNHYLSVQWQILRGISSNTIQAIGFLSVSHTMYTELVVHIVAESLFKTYFFQNMDTDLARKFCLAARLVVVPPNEVIIQDGDLIRRMYVIRRGYVEVYFRDTNLKLDILTSGQSFGEVDMIFGEPSRVTVRTLTYAEIVIIDYAAFEIFMPMSKVHGEELNKIREQPEALQKFHNELEVPNTPEIQAITKKYRSVSQTQPNFYVYRKKKRKSHSNSNATPHFEESYVSEFKNKKFLRYFLFRFTFLPTGSALKVWEIFRFLSIICVLFFIPILEAHPLAKQKYGVYIYILDSITFVDMIIRMHVAYYDSKTNELITHPLLTAKNYFTAGFHADLIGSLPVYLIIDTIFKASPIDESILAYLFRLNRLILIYRVWGLYIYGDSSIVNKQNARRIVKLMPIFFFHFHIMTCLATVLACPSTITTQRIHDGCYENTWITRGKHPAVEALLLAAENSSLPRPAPLTSFQIYTFSFYFVATTSVGCGFADFTPDNELERTYTSLVFFCYIFIIIYILASMAGSKSHKDYKLLRYQQHMNYLVGYLGREKLESRLTSRVIRYYDYQWVRTKGVEPQKLFSNLLPALRKEVSIFVFEDVINQIPILQDVPVGFLRSLCVCLTPVYFLRHDVIVRREDICDIIYFIFRGKVAITNVRNDEAELDEGGIIGFLNPNAYNPVYEVTATAITNVDMFTLKRKDFIRVVRGYPTVADRFTNRENNEGEPTMENRYSNSFPTETWRRSNSDPGREYSSGNFPFSRTSSDNGSYLTELARHNRNDDSLSGTSEEMDEMRQTLSEVVALVIEEEKQEEVKYDEDTLYAQSILPESKVFKILNIAVLLASSLSASLAAYQWSFRNFAWPYFLIGYTCDVIYIVKMGLSFRVSFVDEMGEVVTDFTEIENKYISDPLGFALDFLSTIPLELFALTVVSPVSLEGRLLWTGIRLNRLLRLIHLWLYFAKRSDGFIVHLVRLKLARLAVLTAIYFHFCTCILHGFTAFREYSRICICNQVGVPHSLLVARNTSLENIILLQNFCRPNMTQSNTTVFAPEAWFHTKTFDEPVHSFCSPYTMTLYFIITTFTTTAYGDIFAVTAFEMYFISFVAVSSKVWLGLALSDILSGIQNNTNLSYHLAADGVLKLYHDYGVSRDVLLKTIKYFTFAWIQNRGIIFPDFLSRAPACLRMDVCATIYGEHFRKSYLFRDLSESFIRHASIRLRHEWILTNDFVIRQTETDDKLYFIHKGIVEYSKEVTDPDGHVNSNRGFLTKSRYFGETNGILGSQPHEYSYRAETNLDIVSLKHDDIEELFDLFPQHRLKILRRFYGKYSTMFHSSSDFEKVGLSQPRNRSSFKLSNFEEWSE